MSMLVFQEQKVGLMDDFMGGLASISQSGFVAVKLDTPRRGDRELY